ncbi:MAG TPA: nuclear transport factor 2 family protein [Gaiellales bacterium]|jgi:ketosteroid isomerase-like protein
MTPTEALRAVCDAWERGDPDAAAAQFAPDGVYEDPLYPAPLQGREAIRVGLAQGMAAISDCNVTLDPVLEQGHLVLAVGYFGSRLVDGGGRFDFPFAILVSHSDAGIERLAEYFDTRPLVG